MDSRRFDVLHQTTDNHSTGVIAERVHVHLNGIFEVLVNQHRMVWLHLHGFAHVAVEFLFVEHHLHGSSAQDVGGTHDDWIAHPRRHGPCLLLTACQAIAGLADVQIPEDGFELFAVLGPVDRFRRGAPDAGAGCAPLSTIKPAQQGNREFQRRLSTELHHHAIGTLRFDHIENVLQGERFEVEAVAGVVISGHRFRIAVHHHRGDPLILPCKGGMAAAVVEFDPLPDPVGSTTEDHHLAAALAATHLR